MKSSRRSWRWRQWGQQEEREGNDDESDENDDDKLYEEDKKKQINVGVTENLFLGGILFFQQPTTFILDN